VGRSNSDGAAYETYPWLPVASFVPSQWPDYQPCTISGDVDDFEIDNIIGKTKVAEYMKYLANVRSLPIGVRGRNESYVDNVAALTPSTSPYVNSEANRFMEYRVSMPFLSGIYHYTKSIMAGLFAAALQKFATSGWLMLIHNFVHRLCTIDRGTGLAMAMCAAVY